MARRFYFDLMKGSTIIRDDEGVVASDIFEAAEEAAIVVEETRGSAEMSALAAGWKLIIRDEGGAILKTLPIV